MLLQRLNSGAARSAIEYGLLRHEQKRISARVPPTPSSNMILLLLPTTPVSAPPIERAGRGGAGRLADAFYGAFNLTGLPAVLDPLRFFTPKGCRSGLQIVAPDWGEASRCGCQRSRASHDLAAAQAVL